MDEDDQLNVQIVKWAITAGVLTVTVGVGGAISYVFRSEILGGLAAATCLLQSSNIASILQTSGNVIMEWAKSLFEWLKALGRVLSFVDVAEKLIDFINHFLQKMGSGGYQHEEQCRVTYGRL